MSDLGDATPVTGGQWSAAKAQLLSRLLLRGAVEGFRPPVMPRDRTPGQWPLSFAQERLWFLHRLQPDSPAYNIMLTIPLERASDPSLVDRALAALLERHEILRTVFPAVDGTPVQRVISSSSPTITVVELHADSEEDRNAKLSGILATTARVPFDLAAGPLVRVTRVLVTDLVELLVFTLHHIVIDGWSVDLLMRDFYLLYFALLKNEPSPLPALRVQYADFAVWQRYTLCDEALAGHLQFWKANLAGLPTLQLPTDRPRPEWMTFRGASESRVLSPELSQALREVSRRERVTLYVTLLAAFKVLLSRFSGQGDFAVGTPIANRDRTELAQLIGFFVNMLVLRTDLSDARSFRDALQRVRATTHEAFAHQEIPFEKVVAELVTGRDPGRNPLFQVTFAIDQAPSFQPPRAEEPLSTAMPDQPVRFDLEAMVRADAERLTLTLAYNTDLFDAASVQRMLEGYIVLLEGFTADLDRPLADQAIAPEATLTTVEFLSQLRALDVTLALDGDRLRINAPPGVLTPALKAELARRKESVLELLRPTLGGKDPPIVPVPREQELPVSLPQQRLWFLDRLDPGSATYNIAGGVRLRRLFNHDALARTVDEIVRRHESLRTCFPTVDGVPRVVIRPAGKQQLEFFDLRALPEAERGRRAEFLCEEMARRPFDLARGPLFRTLMVQVRDDEHLFAFCMHHIVSDGWSLMVFGRELGALYSAFAAGRPSPLPPIPVQYVDYAHWQRERSGVGALDAQERYWTRQLAGKLPVLELPSDRPRPPVQTINGARSRWQVSAELTNALKQFSRGEGATLYMTLLTAFKVLLHRYTGEVDLIVGSPTANRGRPEVENVIGFFVNVLVLRTDVSGNPTFRDLLGRVRRVLLNAHANQDVPFDRLVELLRPERDTSHPPLFQVLFNSPTTPIENFAGTAPENQPLDIQVGTARFDLSVEVIEEKAPGGAGAPDLWKSAGLRLYFEYNTDLFDAATIERMQRHYTQLLEGVIAHPDQRVGELPILPAPESRKVVEEWNATSEYFDRERCVHQLIEAQAARTPEAVALTDGAETVTYAELDARANRLARYLIRLGVTADVLVGICLDRSVDMVVSVLATLKAGGAYVPMDPAYPEERLRFMVEDANVAVLVTTESLRSRLPPGNAWTVSLDIDREAIAKEGAGPLPSAVTSRNLAYVIYTSGSTGKPKGVQVEHRSVVNFLESMKRTPGVRADDTMLAVTTLSFDIAGLELFLPLAVGARLVLAGRAAAADASQLLALLTHSGATVMQATPATWRLLLEGGWEGTPGLKVLCGGEALPTELANRLLEKAGSVWNMYGPTEATIWSTLHQVAPGERPVPIGRPIANTRVYILDADRRPVPIGITGELYLGGDGLARGYLNRPEQTAEQFVPDPFARGAGARLYRTGDLARYRADGTLEWLGRVDGQIKLRGFRIELGEIEAALSEHPAVRQAAVALREPRPGDQRLAAYVVPGKGAEVSGTELQSFLKARLPDYMVPTSFAMLNALPLTPNGKVNRQALPDPDASGASGRTFVSPRTETERMVAAVWAEVLGVPRVGLHDNFFDLGGHSLLIVRVHSRIENLVKNAPSLVEFFQYPTVASFSERLTQGPPTVPKSFERARERARRQLEA